MRRAVLSCTKDACMATLGCSQGHLVDATVVGSQRLSCLKRVQVPETDASIPAVNARIQRRKGGAGKKTDMERSVYEESPRNQCLSLMTDSLAFISVVFFLSHFIQIIKILSIQP